jgi:uncharacterized protein (TIGR02145 family)
MKRTLFVMTGFLYSVASYGQVGINTESPKATLDVVGGVGDGTRPEGFIAPRITGDALFAASANGQYGAEQNGTIVFVKEPVSLGNNIGQTINVTQATYYYFDAVANVWKKMGDDRNIFNTDGTLTDQRVMDMNGNTFGMLNGKLGVGTDAPHSSSILELQSSTKGFLPPRMTKLQMESLVNPSLALIIYCTDCFAGNTGCLMINDSADETTPRWGSLCSSNMPVPDIEYLDCNSSSVEGAIYEGQEAHNVTASISYTNGNGASYAQSSFVRNGLTFLLPAGTLANGNGTLSYRVSGIPTTVGEMLVWLSFAGSSCGMYVTVLSSNEVLLPGNNKAWMRHNLGADVDLDPDIPVQEISGNYYQWGVFEHVATDSTPQDPIVGWNSTNALSDAWLDTAKTANDPCPSGFRVPTDQQMTDMVNNTSQSKIGTFIPSASNFGAAFVFSSGAAKMTLPANGYRSEINGSLGSRGDLGYYWTSTAEPGNRSKRLFFNKVSSTVGVGSVRSNAFSVRCIRE